MSRAHGAVALVTLAACGGAPAGPRRSEPPYTEVVLDTQPGLSGLAADDAGGLWTVSERGAEAYHVTLDKHLVPTIERFAIDGIPANNDLESIEVLGGGRFAFGTEGKVDGISSVLTAQLAGPAIEVTGRIILPADQLGVELVSNLGAEGLCGANRTLIAGIESTGEVGGRRWAPLVRIEGDAIVRVYRMSLTTDTGKLSALDCTIADDGTVTGWAIERHFAVTKVLRFTLPPVGRGPDEVEPVVAADLGPIVGGKLNLEGIAQAPDGRVYAVVDNQWKRIVGPSLLLVFSRDALR